MLASTRRLMLTGLVPTTSASHTLATHAQVGHQPKTQSTSYAIQIPDKIRRSPTAVLQALSETVGRDPTGGHYKFMDDPYFQATTAGKRINFARSKEMGRKAARWLVSEWPTLFMYSHDQPRMDAFRPEKTPVESEETGATEAELVDRISQSYVLCALRVYRNGSEQGAEFSWEAKLALLEALCYHNGQDPPAPLWPEELSAERTSRGKANVSKWSAQDHPAEDLYLALIEDSAVPPEIANLAHAAMIAGLAKWGEPGRALQMLRDTMNTEEAVLPAECLTEVLHSIRETQTGDEILRTAMKLVKGAMASNSSFRPDVGLFAELLFIAGRHRNQDCCELTLKLASDMQALGVQPTLLIYRSILRNLQISSVFRDIFYDILDDVENRSFQMTSQNDAYFFPFALACAMELNDLRTVYRVYEMAYFGSNGATLSEPTRETKFLSNFLSFLRQNDKPDNFMKAYKSLVPLSFCPTNQFFTATLAWIEDNQLYHLVPVFWSDFLMTSVGYEYGNEVMNQFLALMDAAHSFLPHGGKHFVVVARSLRSYLDTKRPAYAGSRDEDAVVLPHGAWNESYVNVTALLFARGGEVDECLAVLRRYIEPAVVADTNAAPDRLGHPKPPKSRYPDRVDEGKRRISFEELLLPTTGTLQEILGLFLDGANAGKARTLELVRLLFEHGQFSSAPSELPRFVRHVKGAIVGKFILKQPEEQWLDELERKYDALDAELRLRSK